MTDVFWNNLPKADAAFVHHTLGQYNVFEPLSIAATEAVESMESQCNRTLGIGIANHELPLFVAGRAGYFRENF